jgi:hypothetical protein
MSTRHGVLFSLLLSGAISITWGSFIAATSYSGLGALKGFFYGTRCLMHHSDPYNPAVLQQTYALDGGKFPPIPADEFVFRHGMLVCVNLPTSLFLVVPLAILPWRIASVIWLLLNAAGLLAAAFLIWKLSKNYALKPATLLICLWLANLEIVLGIGNLAGIVVSLCLIAVWCFVEEQAVTAGILCLAVSLVLKPHDVGMLWAYFLLAGGAHRKRALQALGVAAALALPAMLWVSYVAPQWPHELNANLHALSAHGSVNDPGPDSLTFHSADHIISLQSTLSLIRDDPHFYNPATYAICGLLLLAGAIRVINARYTRQNAWYALAAVAALSMLVVYHRAYDAKLLLLEVPACAMLWREGGRLKWLAGLMTTLSILCTADLPLALLLVFMEGMKGNIRTGWGKVLTACVFHPAPLILLVTGLFYLWVYFLRTTQERRAPLDACELHSAPST